MLILKIKSTNVHASKRSVKRQIVSYISYTLFCFIPQQINVAASLFTSTEKENKPDFWSLKILCN